MMTFCAKSLQATRIGAGDSAVAVHVFRSRVPEVWRSAMLSNL